MDALSRVSIVLPSLDPDEKLTAVIEGMLNIGFSDIILVNDGSRPEKLHYFEEAVAVHPQVHLLHHEVNRGKGAALKTAFSWFLKNRPQGLGVVTVDGDNQHLPQDTLACVKQMLKSGHVILGVRDFGLKQVPLRSRFGNKMTSLVFRIFCGMKISDTQTGLRAIPRAIIEDFIEVEGDRFEYETNMLLAMKEQHIGFEEVKCTTVYIEENKSSHFRVIRDSWRIYKLLFKHFLRYTLISLMSALLDEGIFTFLSWLLQSNLTGLVLTAIPTIVARIISSLFNFTMNKCLVFRSKANWAKSLVKYYMLAIPQLILQLLLTHGVCILLGVKEGQTLLRAVIYAVVMMVLFIVSYVVQKRWVFIDRQEER